MAIDPYFAKCTKSVVYDNDMRIVGNTEVHHNVVVQP